VDGFLCLKYLRDKDIFTEYIFYEPLNQQINKAGFPFESDNSITLCLGGLPVLV